MNSANYLVRRATVDDLPALTALWRAMRFPVPELELEKRLTEFQVAMDADGHLLGGVRLEMVERQGHIKYEAFIDFALADQLRPLFWERIQNLAANHGLFRLWTQEDAPFWKRSGLKVADAETLQKLPAAWNAMPGEWLVLQLRDEAAMQAIAMEKEFAALMQLEKDQTQKALDQARMLKFAATLLAIMLAVFVAVMVLYAFRRDPALLQEFSGGWRK